MEQREYRYDAPLGGPDVPDECAPAAVITRSVGPSCLEQLKERIVQRELDDLIEGCTYVKKYKKKTPEGRRSVKKATCEQDPDRGAKMPLERSRALIARLIADTRRDFDRLKTRQQLMAASHGCGGSAEGTREADVHVAQHGDAQAGGTGGAVL